MKWRIHMLAKNRNKLLIFVHYSFKIGNFHKLILFCYLKKNKIVFLVPNNYYYFLQLYALNQNHQQMNGAISATYSFFEIEIHSDEQVLNIAKVWQSKTIQNHSVFNSSINNKLIRFSPNCFQNIIKRWILWWWKNFWVEDPLVLFLK